MAIKLAKSFQSNELLLEIFKDDDELTRVILENDDETDFSFEFNSDNSVTLFVKDWGSCEIEDSSSLKELIETVISEKYNGDLNNVIELIDNLSNVGDAIENISLIHNKIEEFNTPERKENSTTYNELKIELNEQKSLLKTLTEEINELKEEIKNNFVSEESNGEVKYGEYIKVNGVPIFFEFSMESKQLISESWNDPSFDRGDIKKWHAEEKEYTKTETAISEKEKKITETSEKINETNEKIDKTNPLDLSIKTFELKDNTLKLVFDSEITKEYELSNSSYESLIETNINQIFETLEQEVDMISETSVDFEKILSNEEIFTKTIKDIFGDDDLSIGNFVYDDETKTTSIELEENGERLTLIFNYDDENKTLVLKGYDDNENLVEMNGETEQRIDVSGYGKNEVQEFTEGRYGKYETEVSPLSYRGAERVDFTLSNDETVSVNVFETKYGTFYEIFLEDRIYETENKDELLQILKNIENNIPITEKPQEEKYSNSFVLTKLEVIKEKIHDLGVENILNNKELEQERVLNSCFSILGDHSLTDEEKTTRIENLFEKCVLNTEEIESVREQITLYNEHWKTNNIEETNPTPDVRIEKGEVARFSANEMGARQMVRYDIGESSFKVNTLYFDKENFRFQTGYTFKQDGKTYVKFNEVMNPIDITGSEQYKDLSYIVASVDKNGTSTIYEIFREIGLNVKKDLTPEKVKELTEIIQQIEPALRKSFDDETIDKKFFAVQTVVNDIVRNTDIMKELYASLTHSGVSEKEQEISWLEQLNYYESNIENSIRISCEEELNQDLVNYTNLETEKQNCISGCQGVIAAIQGLNDASSWREKGFSFYYSPATFLIGLPILALKNFVLGHTIKCKNLETGQIEKVTVRLTPAEVWKLYPRIYNYALYDKYVELRKEYIQNKATLKLLGITERQFTERYGSFETLQQTIDLRNEINTLENNCLILGAEIDNKIKDLELKIEANNKDIKTIDENIDKNKKEISKIDKNINDIRKQIEQTKNDKKLTDEEKNSKVSNLEKQAKNLEEKRDKLLERNSQNEKTKSDLQEKNKNLESNLRKLESSKNELSKSIENLRDTKSNLEADPKSNIETSSSRVEKLKQDIEKLKNGETDEKRTEQRTERRTPVTERIRTLGTPRVEVSGDTKVETRVIDGTSLQVELTHVDDRIVAEAITDTEDPSFRVESTDESFEEVVSDIIVVLDEEAEAYERMETTIIGQDLIENFEIQNPNSLIEIEESNDGNERIYFKGEKVEMTTSRIESKDEEGNPLSLENTKVNVVLIEPETGIKFNFGEHSMSLTRTDINKIGITFNKLDYTEKTSMSERIDQLRDSIYRSKSNFGIESITTPEGETISVKGTISEETNAVLEALGIKDVIAEVNGQIEVTNMQTVEQMNNLTNEQNTIENLEFEFDNCNYINEAKWADVYGDDSNENKFKDVEVKAASMESNVEFRNSNLSAYEKDINFESKIDNYEVKYEADYYESDSAE